MVIDIFVPDNPRFHSEEFPQKSLDQSSKLYLRAGLPCFVSEICLADVSSVVPGAHGLVTSGPAVAGGSPPASPERLAMAGRHAPSLFPVPAERGQGLPQSQPGKWHRPSAVTQKRHQPRPKGEAAKQRTSEQPLFTLSALRGPA
jgi:hypothetical protein